MIKIKKGAFTLSEVLITLAIIGALAILVIPGIVKDANNKAMMSLLQSTVSDINDIVQNELVRTRAVSLEDTNMVNDPAAFLKTLDYSKVSTNSSLVYKPDDGYKTYSGSSSSEGTGTFDASVLLKNGVGVGIKQRSSKSSQYSGQSVILVNIDLNGKNEPNVIGVDMFELELAVNSDTDEGIHAGNPIEYSQDQDTNKTGCISNGYPYACYSYAVLSGFDPNYLSED